MNSRCASTSQPDGASPFCGRRRHLPSTSTARPLRGRLLNADRNAASLVPAFHVPAGDAAGTTVATMAHPGGRGVFSNCVPAAPRSAGGGEGSLWQAALSPQSVSATNPHRLDVSLQGISSPRADMTPAPRIRLGTCQPSSRSNSSSLAYPYNRSSGSSRPSCRLRPDHLA